MKRSRLSVGGMIVAGALSLLAEGIANAQVCPAFGADTDCGTIIAITDAGTSVTSTGQGPYDSIEDTLIGVVNNGSQPIRALGLRSAATIFGFDGDGIDTFGAPGNALDSTGYGGPNAFFSNIDPTLKQGVVNFIVPIPPGGGTAYFSLEEAISNAFTCKQVIDKAVVLPIGPFFTSISATFTPNLGLDLSQAANFCGVTKFDWQQTITSWPAPSNLLQVGNATGLVAPPSFLDPPAGGYEYFKTKGWNWNSFPYYWDANTSGQPWSLDTNSPGNASLKFFDSPQDPLLPAGAFLGFVTRLVGINADGSATDLGVGFNWQSTFNGTSGGISVTANIAPLDPATGTGNVTLISVQDTTNYQYNGLTVTTVNGTPVIVGNRLPVASCKAAVVASDGTCHGNITVASVDNGSSDPDGDPINCTVTPSGGLALGNTAVTLTCTDPTGASGSCSATVAVTDTSPPVVVPPANVSVATCTDTAVVTTGAATATDNCAGSLVPTGQVVATNGVTLATPIPIVGGHATLKIGTHTVQWAASDGVNTGTANQTIVIGASIQASQSFVLDDRAQVRNSAGGFGAMVSSGAGPTSLGNDGRSGAVVSVGPVVVLHRAVANGNVVSAGSVTKESDATITGSIVARGSVVLPPAPSLPAFPALTSAAVTVNSATTRTLPPGAYVAATVNGGTLVLSGGDYYLGSLTINSGSIVRATAATRVFVRDAMVLNAPFRASSGTAVQPVFVGFAGTSLALNAQLDGTLVAPAASVGFGTGAGLTFTGSFFGRTLEVNPGSTLVCKVN